MNKPALIIKELSIYKMPGFPSGMESITSLANNINVIAGPNASGKSSTARMIQNVIWKQNIEKIHVETKLLVSDEDWDIKIDNGHYSSQCNGVDDNLSSIPAYDESKRYFLALHELIKEDDKNLAEEILRETIGGYNLQEAQQALAYRDNMPNRGLGEYKSYEAKRKNVEEIEKRQRNLQSEGQKLLVLQEKYAEARNATQLKQLYERLIDSLKAKKDYEILTIEGASYPEQMSLVIGNEDAELLKLENVIENTTQEINGVCRDRENKENELLALQIPDTGFDKVTLGELSENVDKLSDLERDLQNRQIEKSKSEIKTKIVLNDLFSSLTKEKLEALDLENLRNLDGFFDEAHRLLNKKETLENQIQHLNNQKQEHHHTEKSLYTGIRLLLNWFEKDTTTPSSSRLSLWILFFIGLTIAPLTYFYGWIGLVGVVVMLLYILFNRQNKTSSSIQETRVNDFKKTGLAEPVSWQEEEVSKRLEELHQELHEVKQQSEIDRRIAELSELIKQINPELQKLETKRQDWIDKLSDIPELSVENRESYSGLYWILKNLQEWQKHNNELQANLISYNEMSKIYSETLAHFNSILHKVNVAPANDVASAKAILKKMNEDDSIHSALVRDIRYLEERKVDLDASKEKDKQEVHSIYNRLNLEIGARDALRELLSKKEAYDFFKNELEQAKRRRMDKENRLQEHVLYADIKDTLLTLHIEEAEEREKHYEALSSEAEDLYTEIAKIEARINREKSGHELEVALSERESVLDDLEQNYLNTIASITGSVIVNGLKKKTQEHSSSKVFNRANELFNQITHGHYELILDDKEGGSFRAKDTVLNQGQPLEHLSSGTRIQLLIAVRLAFIESQESGIKLPILADEVLANSDDLRAKQIIESLIEISRDGRQIFYFTAQADELKKWQEYLALHSDIQGQITLLKGQANEEINFDLDEPAEKNFLSTTVLSPGTYSNEEYHELLNAPQYSLLVHTPEQLYLSYLLEDNQLLHAFLLRGIEYYGQLKSYISHQGKIEGLSDSTLAKIESKVELLEFYQSLFTKGRAKPIDRQVLTDSDCVSSTFIDTVDAKLKELDQNPERLIAALRAREVSGFMRSKINELEEYLLEHNYMDGDEQLTPDELRIQTHAALSRMELSVFEADCFLKKVSN